MAGAMETDGHRIYLDRREKDLGPKAPADCPNNPDLLWLDAYSQQALAALYILRIAELLGDIGGADEWRAKHAAKKEKINELYWDESSRTSSASRRRTPS